MLNDVLVAVPSYKRADRVLPTAAFAGLLVTVFVPESQVDEYKLAGVDADIVGVPDSIDGIGTVATKCNWILNWAGAKGFNNVLRVDDDVVGIGTWNGREHRQLDVPDVTALVCNGFRMAREAGAPLWGLNILKDKRAYSVFRPFSLLSPVLGPFTGHVLPHGLKYDAKMGTKEDYDLWLQAIAKYRRTLRFQKYHYLKKEETRGGLYTTRTMERERQHANAITRKWGSVIRYDASKKNILDARLAIPINGC